MMNAAIASCHQGLHPSSGCLPSSLATSLPAADHPELFHCRGFTTRCNGDARLVCRLPVSTHAAPAGGVCLAVEVDTKHLHYEREEAKAMLCEFLRNQGYGRSQAARLANRSPLFINDLVSTLARRFRARYLSGRELTTLEIRTVIDPYLEGIASQTDDIAEFLECFPNPPGVRPPGDVATSAPDGRFEQRSKRASSSAPRSTQQAEGTGRAADLLGGLVADGRPRPAIPFFQSLGLTEEQIVKLVKRFPGVLSYSVDNKLQPVVHFFLELGLAPEDIPKTILRWPQVVGCSLEENLRPKVVQLEAWGVKPEAWPKLVPLFPRILTTSHEKQASVVHFLREVLGLKPEDIGKVIMRFPHIMGYSVEGKLVPVVQYLQSLGIADVGPMITRCPQLFGLSLKTKIQPVTTFFLSTGRISPSDAALMMFRFPTVVGLSVESTLRPKWEALLLSGMDPREVVRFPQYFGYSLEGRIRPRLRAIAAQGNVDWSLNRALTPSDVAFHAEWNKRNEEALDEAVAPQPPPIRSTTKRRDGNGPGTSRGENGNGAESSSGRALWSDMQECLESSTVESEGLWHVRGAEQSMGCASGSRGDEIVGLGILRLGRNGASGNDDLDVQTELEEKKKMVLRQSNGVRSGNAGTDASHRVPLCRDAGRSRWREED